LRKDTNFVLSKKTGRFGFMILYLRFWI
jgi:hypothetical protein